MFGPNGISRWDYWVPYASLDTNIDIFDWCHIFDVICVICVKCHLISNDTYDIKIWCKSIWPILVSNEGSGLQHWQPMFFHILCSFPFAYYKTPDAEVMICRFRVIWFHSTNWTDSNLNIFWKVSPWGILWGDWNLHKVPTFRIVQCPILYRVY